MVKKYPDAVAMYWIRAGWGGDDAKTCHATFEKFETLDDLMIDEKWTGVYYICKF